MKFPYSQIPFIPINFIASFFYHVYYYLFRPLFKLMILKIEGRENLPAGDSFIIAANHNSWIDGALLVMLFPPLLHRRIYFIAVFWNFWFWFAGLVFLNPFRKSKSVEKTLSYLEKGKIICIFPEGRSNQNSFLLKGKTGVARLALLSGKPVLPFGIIGSRGTHFTSIFQFIFRPWMAEIRIGQPMSFPKRDVNEITRELLHQTTDTIMRAIAPLSGKPYPY